MSDSTPNSLPGVTPFLNLPEDKQNVALDMAYRMGGRGGRLEFRLWRMERGNVMLRAGQPVTNQSQFSASSLYTNVSTSATTNGNVDPTKAGVLKTGSTPPTIAAPNFTFTASSTTALTISWSNYASLRADGTAIVLQSGSLAITGLVASTHYYFFPFWSEAAQAIGWVNGAGTGTPRVAFTSGTDASLQTQNLQGNFTFGVIDFTMPGSGTSSGTSGSVGSAPTGTGNQRLGYRLNLT